MPDPITDAEIKKVLELAEKATPGPWGHRLWTEPQWLVNASDSEYHAICLTSQGHDKPNAEYIAFANPAFVTRLITELLSLRKASHSVSQCCPESERLAKRVEELEAIVSRLPKTADGVPIYNAMKIFVVTDNDGIQEDAASAPYAFIYNHYPVEECYSTRAAAELAKGVTNE